MTSGDATAAFSIAQMNATIAQVVESLGLIAPFDKAAGWDPVGLQLGDPNRPASRVGVCHEVTEEVVASVEAHLVDLLVAYHPLLFRPTATLVAGTTPSGRAMRLLEAGIGLCVVHTAFDVADGGTADALAAALGLTDIVGFGPAWAEDSLRFVTFVPEATADAVAEAMSAAGAGRIGNYTGCSFRTHGVGTFDAPVGTDPVVGRRGERNQQQEVRLEMLAPRSARDAVAAAIVASHPYEEPAFDVVTVQSNSAMVGRVGSLDGDRPLDTFAAEVSQVLGSPVRQAGDGRSAVRRVAVLPGLGGDFIGQAVGAADVIVTGDVSHHRAREALDRGLAILDPGHAATERPGVASLYAAVSKIAQDAVDLTHLGASPWKES